MTRVHNFCELGRAVLETEAQAILQQRDQINHHFSDACEKLLACEGRIILVGLGKSGHIARKIAATFASTGSPAFFIHAAEAIHGDLGMITGKDIVIALSRSGETREIVSLIPELKRMGTEIIALTGEAESTLAKEADICITIRIEKEACPLGLAPTSSTTATLAMGDALAIALLDARGFTKKDFALSHPGGQLGKSLLHVSNLMHQGADLPLVDENATLEFTLTVMSEKKMGSAFIIDRSKKLLGIFTDGDIRRYLSQHADHLSSRQVVIKDIVRHGCKTIHQEAMVEEALLLMETMKITVLPVVNDHHHPVGIIHMHDLLQARLA